ncbi:MAG: alkyl hydroperoxide reductase [Pseudopedobacter saltans]|uniref:Alkyl hydroperoxide reductase n=1 Tax=Pseudopedobacter saltans TaxID=151895 RepID=A0A2W5GZR8_9SPHI|nr:MAG: alkyl hydroperoxide reductase [Pseudopedobacter saltans]
MFRKKIWLFVFLSSFLTSALRAQESNGEKKMWAKSFLNEKAPALTVESWITQKPETKGKFVLVDFWATWCPPCRKFIPILNNISEKHKEDLVVIGITDETAAKVESMQGIKGIYYEATDSKKTMSKVLQVSGIPHVILIDPKGIVRWEGFPLLSGHELTDEVVSKLIEKYK